ncbi:common plant regulatory factor 1-like isoform X2 [Impatiens glandulifera]|uniref:common plant regulatory factor 1-like isoform X2 n=1 Tax=Impatiens glandulifera TaxID=253017 RepID=UPI001FB04DF3|nr:common plant regulatory factor 1-like isoform X2 [Impatiens glandulifera]
MGNGEEPKSEKAIPPPVDQTNVHAYPDWAAMQAYYGPRVAIPQYFNSTVASDHAPHPYMWGPAQPMMPPYGIPYGAIYAHGGIYAHAHPGVSFAPTLDVETPTKSTDNTDQGLMKKKLKGFDGLTMSIGNGNADSADTGANRNDSHSSESDGSSDGSIGNAAGAPRKGKKRSREETPTTDGDGNTETQKSQVPVGIEIGAVGGNFIKLELGNPSSLAVQATTNSLQPCATMATETWLKNDRELKRERRKQSNRESARRSRLRKQAEAEELEKRVDALSTENASLKSEINFLTGNSEKLKLENVALTEKLNRTQPEKRGGDVEGPKWAPVSTENLLERVDKSGPPPDISNVEIFKKKTNSGMKLRQLLDSKPRADAVAAS